MHGCIISRRCLSRLASTSINYVIEELYAILSIIRMIFRIWKTSIRYWRIHWSRMKSVILLSRMRTTTKTNYPINNHPFGKELRSNPRRSDALGILNIQILQPIIRRSDDRLQLFAACRRSPLLLIFQLQHDLAVVTFPDRFGGEV